MTFDIIIGRSKHDVAKFGKRGTIFVAKQYVQMGQTTSLSNPVYMDVAGAHVVFIVGKRGSGKCLLGDSIITLSNGKQIKIEDLDKNKNKIMSLDNNLKIISKRKTNFHKRSVKEIIKIKLKSGKSIKLTPEHPLLTIDGWKPIKEINKDTRIATPRIINCFGNNKISKHETKLLAYLIAEGHMDNGFVLFTNKDNLIIQEFKRSVKIFDSSLIINNHSSKESLRIVQYKKRNTKLAKRNVKGQFEKGSKFEHKTSLREYLEKQKLYKKKSIERFLPDTILEAPKEKIILFLNRLFSCDGSIYKTNNNWFISYASSSKRLILDVNHLLLRFGIIGNIRKKRINRFISYEIQLYGVNVKQFIQEIGFYGIKEKKSKIAIKYLNKKKNNPNNDTIPKEIWKKFKPKSWVEIGKALNYKIPKSVRSSINYSPSRDKLKVIAKVEKNDQLSDLANSDIYWDKIISKKKIKGNFKVYDLTVPKTHNFIANAIIVHNSYTMGSIAEGLADLDPEIKQNLSIVLLDTMGIYWTMKYPNFQDSELIKKWGFDPKGLDVKIYTPSGFYYKYKDQGIPTDFPFSIRPLDVDPDDWCRAFNISPSSAEGVLITKVTQILSSKKIEISQGNFENYSYSVDEMIELARGDTETGKVTSSVVVNLLEKAKGWEIFSKDGTPLKDIVSGGQVTVLDVSPYATMSSGWEIKALVVGLICRTLFNQRMLSRKTEEFKSVDSAMHYFSKDIDKKMEDPLVWVAIDEAHELLPREGKTAASDALITILREGRQPGISLILATQQPAKIHTDVMTQSDVVISHRLTAKMDTEALGLLMQSYMRKGLDQEINSLPRLKGAAVIFDDSNETIFPVQMRPRFTWHGGSSPTAIKEKKNNSDDILKKIKDLE